MNSDTEKYIDEMRKNLNTVLDIFTVEDFRRVHAKFFGAILALEIGFKRRFPEESAKYEKEVYGDDVL